MSTFNRSGVSHVAGAALLGPRANAYTWLLAGASKLRPRQRCVCGGQVCKATLACSGSLMLQGTAFHPLCGHGQSSRVPMLTRFQGHLAADGW